MYVYIHTYINTQRDTYVNIFKLLIMLCHAKSHRFSKTLLMLGKLNVALYVS